MFNRPLAVFVASLALLLAACPNEFGQGLGPGDEVNTPADDPYWCCDPDDPEGCTCTGYWHCTEGADGTKSCIQQNPELPDDGALGGWDCQYLNDLIVCEGDADEHPEAGQGGGWDCQSNGEMVTCERQQEEDDIPDGGAGGPYDCVFQNGGDARRCEQPGDSGDLPDDGWDCLVGADGRTTCRNEEPEMPEGGDWDCYREGSADVCVGNEMPDDEGGGEWDCQRNGEMVVCENDEGQNPFGDDGGGADWDCTWGENFLVCQDEDENGDGGEGGEDDNCACIAGASRYCDEPQFCNWGRQTCETQGNERRWGTCAEVDVLNGCQPGGADARDYEWNYRDGFWDGQVNDPDGDGMILMPPDWWYNPSAEDCAIRKGFCVQDMWDLDNDMDNLESLGDCADIQQCV
ncbi:MAG: hypothetical protein HYY06_16685 [Deltaproteobacteria bacterium]|nr:hypothetical protein [Deltaproteobacteria bacterium]